MRKLQVSTMSTPSSEPDTEREAGAGRAVRIAVPYYGTLSLFSSQMTRVFFLAEVDLRKKAIAGITLEVWDSRSYPTLAGWLRQMRTDGIICGDAPWQQKNILITEGFWVQSQQEGEVHEVVEKWVRENPDLFDQPPITPAAPAALPGPKKVIAIRQYSCPAPRNPIQGS